MKSVLIATVPNVDIPREPSTLVVLNLVIVPPKPEIAVELIVPSRLPVTLPVKAPTNPPLALEIPIVLVPAPVVMNLAVSS